MFVLSLEWTYGSSNINYLNQLIASKSILPIVRFLPRNFSIACIFDRSTKGFIEPKHRKEVKGTAKLRSRFFFLPFDGYFYEKRKRKRKTKIKRDRKFTNAFINSSIRALAYTIIIEKHKVNLPMIFVKRNERDNSNYLFDFFSN